VADENPDVPEMFSQFVEHMAFKLNKDINQVPEPLKDKVIEQIVDASLFLMNSLEKEGKLIEMLGWSQDRITAYEKAILDKHKAERGDD